MIYIIGIGSFIGKNLYLEIKKAGINVSCMTHDEISNLLFINLDENDIFINLCGVNRGKDKAEYYHGNFRFVKNIIDSFKNNKINKLPRFIHFSSIMIHGFLNEDELPEYQRNFISSKRDAEKFLIENYPEDKLCIVRPSNIFGYNCEPYTNNLLVTLIFEKIIQGNKVTHINRNCIRNFLSVENLCKTMMDIIQSGKNGIINIVSNNNINLEYLLKIIYPDSIPTEINIVEGDSSEPGHIKDNSETFCIYEDLPVLIKELEYKMINFLKINDYISIHNVEKISQPKGDITEISGLSAKRLYFITFNEHSIRGNHYHYKQIEDFYTHRGKVLYLLSHKDEPNIILMKILDNTKILRIKPLIIHTLINDFIDNSCEVFVSSTQEFIPGQSPDTEYIISI